MVDGDWAQDKSRGCADGRFQVRGEDYDESYSPTTRITSVRTCESLVAQNGFIQRHVDIDNAFLYGYIEEGYVIYMYPFDGFEEYEDYFCPIEQRWKRDLMIPLLVKGLYGLVQAALLFNLDLVEQLVKMGYRQSIKDQ